MKIVNTLRSFGSSGCYIQGPGEIKNLKRYSEQFGRRVGILIDPFFFEEFSDIFHRIYAAKDNRLICVKFGGQVSPGEIERITAELAMVSPDIIIGFGGGRTIDTAKAAADNIGCSCIIIPTTASSDAPVSNLSVLYSEKNEYLGVRRYKKCPDLVLIDSQIIVNAPVRFLIAGMGDALATYYEAAANYKSRGLNFFGGYTGLAALAIAEMCRKTIIEKGLRACEDARRHICTEDVEDIIEANSLLSGLGFLNAGCAGAHATHAGLTLLPEVKGLHGEVVAFSTLVQLIAEHQPEKEIHFFRMFLWQLGLPITLKELGIENMTPEKMQIVTKKAISSYWKNEPFPVNELMIAEAIRAADAAGNEFLSAHPNNAR